MTWISVDERLPEMGKSVLVTHRCPTCDSERHPNLIWETFFNSSFDGWYGPQVVMGRITHWMEKPEPPKL